MNSIEGVSCIPLKKVVSERGHLLEVQRSDDFHYPGFGQTYITCTLPGIIKAWYRHHRQFDQLALIKGQVMLALYDSREDSPTCDHLLTILMAEDSPQLVQIPPGVWHGFKALGSEPLYLLHLNSLAFDSEQTDEDRLPADTVSIPHQW